jgi:hypothetical protein
MATETTSGTTLFNPDLNDTFEEAFERAGSELRSGYDFRTARRSLNFLLTEWANLGINLWTIVEGEQVLVQGQITYDLPIDTVDLIEHVIRSNAGQTNNQSDITISRISVSTYATIPNKLVQGRPVQVWINRQSGQSYPTGSTPDYNPQFTVWPAPDGTQPWVFHYWRLRRLQDAGSGVNVQDIPFRFQNALVTGLSYMLSLKLPNADPQRIAGLKGMYAEALQLAMDEDREKAPIRFVPRNMMMN